MFDIQAVRSDFPILARQVHGQPLVYFDNAATSQKPQRVLDAIAHYYEATNSNVHQGVHTLSGRQPMPTRARGCGLDSGLG